MELTGRRECAIIEVSDRRDGKVGERLWFSPKSPWSEGSDYGRLTVLEQAEPLKKDGRPGIAAAVTAAAKLQFGEPVFAMEVLQAVAACGGRKQREMQKPPERSSI